MRVVSVRGWLRGSVLNTSGIWSLVRFDSLPQVTYVRRNALIKESAYNRAVRRFAKSLPVADAVPDGPPIRYGQLLQEAFDSKPTDGKPRFKRAF